MPRIPFLPSHKTFQETLPFYVAPQDDACCIHLNIQPFDQEQKWVNPHLAKCSFHTIHERFGKALCQRPIMAEHVDISNGIFRSATYRLSCQKEVYKNIL
jgi:hypothetical protein